MKFFKIVGGLGVLGVGAAVAFTLFIYGPFMTPTYGNPAPTQPIPFPHDRHAGSNAEKGQLGLPCTTCHIFADKSEQAGAPPIQLCMGCHTGIATDKPSIQKLTEHFQKGEPVQWVRVHQLPYFIRFTHKRHVSAGIQCQQCHGQVQEMQVLTRVAPLKMGWCLNCHMQNSEKFEGLGQDPHLAQEASYRDCWTCHK